MGASKRDWESEEDAHCSECQRPYASSTDVTESKYIGKVTVTDPDTDAPVELEIRKLVVSGAMVGIDTSYIEQEVDEVYSPYNENTVIDIPEEESCLS